MVFFKEMLERLFDIRIEKLKKAKINYTGREYQFEYVDFDIHPGERVLDLGSGNHPFPLATDLADLKPENDFDRGGESLVTDSRPFSVVDIESLPYKDNAFDFVYCSHVLEHVNDPISACRELMRIARRGYIETPSRASDLLYNYTYLHRWHVSRAGNALVFIEYSERERNGTGCAYFAAQQRNPYDNPVKELVFNNRDLFVTMFLWTTPFIVYCIKQNGECRSYLPEKDSMGLGPGHVAELCKSNSVEAYDEFWSNEALITAYLEPARLAAYEDVVERLLPYINSTSRVLDVGFGSGDFLRILSDRAVDRKLELTGLDYSSAAVERAKRILPKGSFSTGNVYNMPYADETFDLVCCIQTLEHLCTPERVMREMDRICRSDGLIVITVPNGELDSYEGHVNFWSDEEFKQFVAPRDLIEFHILNERKAFMAIVKPCKDVEI